MFIFVSILLLALSSSARAQSQDLAALRRAADQGSADAQAELGNRYRAGKDVLQDYAHAVVWFGYAE